IVIADSFVGIGVAYSSARQQTLRGSQAESLLSSGSVNGRPEVGAVPTPSKEYAMNSLIKILANLDYHLVRASMVLIFLLFGYQKWFEYEAQTLIPYISNGPLIFWMYPVFGIRGDQLVFGGFGMANCRTLVLRILE